MPSNREEIITEIKTHIGKFGGGFGEWCVGTAKDPRSPFFESHRVAEMNDGLTYREAFTAGSAEAAERLSGERMRPAPRPRGRARTRPLRLRLSQNRARPPGAPQRRSHLPQARGVGPKGGR